jgi:transcriptional regulator with XRE-family HTH domain
MDTNNFALRLKRLFKEKTKPDGKQYSQAEVLDGLQGVVTRVYLWKLRNGRASNPSLQVISGLADFFGVAPGYFFEIDGAQTGSLNDNLAHEIGIRSSVLTPQEQQMVLFMIESIQKVQKNKTT